MIASLFFIFNRLTELVFLIPIIGMLAWFVNGYLSANQLTPAYILVLFIVSVLAFFWSVDTLLRFGTTKRSALFVSFIDLCFVGAFIAGVYQLSFIATANCSHWNTDDNNNNNNNGAASASVLISLGPFGYYGQQTGNPLAKDLNKTCRMLKTCFALGIMQCLFFAWTAFLALFLHRNHKEEVVKETVVTTRRRRSGSHHGGRRGHSHEHSSQHRRRSSSGRPPYVV